MNKTRYLLLPLFIIGLFILSCTDEGLNEMDVMKLSQASALSIQVQDERTQAPIYDAKVTISASGEVLESNTDSSGLVSFNDLSQQDNVRIKVSKNGYFLYNESLDINVDNRSAGQYEVIALNSEQDAAIIKGIVSIQTDLTTIESEHPSGIVIKALNINREILATATTNANGEYELKIPVGSGKSIYVDFPTLQYDQTLKVRDTGNKVVLTTAKKTIFNPYKVAGPVPNTSNVIATVSQPGRAVSGGQYFTASVKALTITAGVITDVEFGYLGQGYISTRNITITSLEGGSGADITCDGLSTGSNTEPYYPVNPASLTLTSGGTGYPVYEPNENVYTISPSGFKWSGTYYSYSFVNTNSKQFNPGDVYVLNVDYGTGTIIGDIPVAF